MRACGDDGRNFKSTTLADLIVGWQRTQFRLLETLALTVLLIVFSVGVFVYALGLPLNIWPSL